MSNSAKILIHKCQGDQTAPVTRVLTAITKHVYPTFRDMTRSTRVMLASVYGHRMNVRRVHHRYDGTAHVRVIDHNHEVIIDIKFVPSVFRRARSRKKFHA